MIRICLHLGYDIWAPCLGAVCKQHISADCRPARLKMCAMASVLILSGSTPSTVPCSGA